MITFLSLNMKQQNINNIFRNKSKSCFLRLCETQGNMKVNSRATSMCSVSQQLSALFVCLSVFLCQVPQAASQDLTRFSQMASQINYQTTNEDTWQHSILLSQDDSFLLQWTPLEDQVVFRITVRTRGYVSFGLNSKPTMDGADIVVGWVHSGKAYLQDRHGEGNQEPMVDRQQDWSLQSAFENDTHTVLIIARAYDTCDSKDYVISHDTTHILWAWHPDDPVNIEHAHPRLHYHAWRRGTTTALLLDRGQEALPKNVLPAYVHGSTLGHRFPLLREPETKHWFLMNQHIEVSGAQDTVFWCNIFKRPDIRIKHHAVRYEPMIKPGSADNIQHMMVYECSSVSPELDAALDQLAETTGHECNQGSLAQLGYTCNHVMAAWTKGSKGVTFPAEVGYPITPDGTKFYMLEVHYTTGGQSFYDSSGLKVVYTPELRMQDAGVISLGLSPNWKQLIPPRQKTILSSGHCVGECTKAALPPSGIHVFGTMHYTHDLGRKVKIRHIRDGEELEPISQDNNHQPDYQEYRHKSQPTRVLPGDHLITECQYNSFERSSITLGGFKTQDETCLSFIYYWPRVELSVCHSKPSLSTVLHSLGIEELASGTDPIKIRRPIELAGKTLEWRLLNYNWKEQFQYFQHATATGTFSPTCLTRGHSVIEELEDMDYKFPIVKVPWAEKSMCHENRGPQLVAKTERLISGDGFEPKSEYMRDGQANTKPIMIIDVDHYKGAYMPVEEEISVQSFDENIYQTKFSNFEHVLEEELKEMEKDLEEELSGKHSSRERNNKYRDSFWDTRLQPHLNSSSNLIPKTCSLIWLLQIFFIYKFVYR